MEAFRYAKTSLSNDFMATDVRVPGLWSLSPVTLGFFGTGDDGGVFEA